MTSSEPIHRADLVDIGWRAERTGRPVSTDAGAVAAVPRVDLAELFREQCRPMVRLAVLLIDDLGVAEDVVQDAFMALQNNRRMPCDHDGIVAYLRATVINKCRSTLRHRYVVARVRARFTTGSDTSDPSTAIEDDAAMLAALQTLPRRQREVLVLRYWADMSHADIADVLHLATGSVKSAASRGLAALRVQLEET